MNKQHQQKYYQITKGRKINQEDYAYVDTKQIQIRSVIEFMEYLGYDYYMWDHTFAKQEWKGAGFKGCETLSFITACNLHNSEWAATTPGYFAPTFKFVKKLGGGYFDSTFFVDAYTLNKAKASKIVCQVFLHSSKKGITCYKHQVKWADSAYEALFLKPIIDKEEKAWEHIGSNLHTLYLD